MQKRNIALMLLIFLNTLLICLIIGAKPTIVAEASTDMNTDIEKPIQENDDIVYVFDRYPDLFSEINSTILYSVSFNEEDQLWYCGNSSGETEKEAIKNYLATVEEIYKVKLIEFFGKADNE